MRVGDDLRRKVEELSEVVKTLGSEGVVVVLPRELGLDEALGGERLHGLDDLEVLDVGDLRVSGSVEVLGGDEDTLCEDSEQAHWSVLLSDATRRPCTVLLLPADTTGEMNIPLKRCSKMAFLFCLEMSIFKRLDL